MAGDGERSRDDVQHALVVHRIAGVDAQVHDDLLQLYRVNVGGQGLIPRVDVQLDARRQGEAQHLDSFTDDRPHLDALGLALADAAERQHLPDHVPGPLAGADDFLQILIQLAVREIILPLQGQPGITQNRRQHVVEIMRNAATELADGLHLSRLQQLILQVFMLLAGSQGFDAKGKVIGQVGEQAEFMAIEVRRQRGDDGQDALYLPGDDQRQQQYGECRPTLSHYQVAVDARTFACQHRGDGLPAQLLLNPRHVVRSINRALRTRAGNPPQPVRLPRFDIIHPGGAIAGYLHDDATHLGDEIHFIRFPHQRLVTGAQGTQGPVAAQQ